MSQRSRPGRTVSSKPVSTRPGSPKTKTVMKRPARWVFWSPPPHANAMASWALLPLRAFLGFTFCFAGLQKLTNPNFFNAQSPSSIQAQLIAANRISPLHVLLGHLLQFATPLGIVIALGELAVGIGALLGLWTRIAALGGMALSAMLFLTVMTAPQIMGAVNFAEVDKAIVLGAVYFAGGIYLELVLYSSEVDRSIPARVYMEPPFFLPEELRLEEALRRMTATGCRLGIVFSPDHGETGLISLQDILRVIFGEVHL